VSPFPKANRPSPGTRVLLVKPGDVLLVGNVGPLDASTGLPAALRLAGEALEKVGILAFMFAGDIELAKVPGLAEQVVTERAKGGYLPSVPVSQHDPLTCPSCAAAGEGSEHP
jgi:hypothetical protein